MNPSTVVCRSCGSSDVEVLDWIDANTNAFVGGNDDPNDDETWCRSCETHSGLTTRARFEVVNGTTPLSTSLSGHRVGCTAEACVDRCPQPRRTL